MKRTISLILAVLMLAGVLVSCAEKADTPKTEDNGTEAQVQEVTEEADTRVYASLPDTDWEGREFRVLGRDGGTYTQFTNFEFFSEGSDGEVVNDAVWTRNQILYDRYKFTVTEEQVSEPQAQVKMMVSAQEDAYELSIAQLQFAGSLAADGYMVPIDSLNYLDFDKPWWSKDVNESLSLGHRLYFTTSDLLLVDKKRTYILIFNRGLAADYNISSLYDSVNNNEWTIDYMNSLLGIVASDINGDGKMTDEDRYGLGMDSYIACYTFAVGCGVRITEKDENDLPVIVYNNDHTSDVADKLVESICNTDQAIFCNDFNGKVSYDYWSVASKVFYAGNELFMAAFPQSLQSISKNTDENFDYGVIPFPKYDESQEKYLTVPDPAHSIIMFVPVTCQNTDFAGFAIEALSAESKYTTLPAYYEISCKTKYTYDQESADMLDLIFSGIQYDLAAVYNWGELTTLFSSVIPSKKTNNFASSYAKKEKSALRAIEKTLEKFEALG